MNIMTFSLSQQSLIERPTMMATRVALAEQELPVPKGQEQCTDEVLVVMVMKNQSPIL